MATSSSQFSDDEDSDTMGLFANKQVKGKAKATEKAKLSGACVDCKSVKVRCEFTQGEKKCRRCQARNLPCHPRERKKRKPADSHERLQERAHEQDLQIQNLLHRYDQLKTDQKINHWVSRASQKSGDTVDVSQTMKWVHKGRSPESAVFAYFSAGIENSSLSLPEIVKHCALYPEEVMELFSIYFSRVNPFFSILDKDCHSAHKLIWTSPFLFSVICAVASRYYSARPHLYDLAMEFARDLAGKALIEGSQSVDVCQAYLIMAMYPVPQKKWVEDRSWLLMGVAVRMAMELGLNQPPPPSCDDREALNRMRTWLHCYYVDASHAIMFGKMPMLPLDDYLARHSRYWYKSSPMNTPYDVHLCASVQMIIHMGEWRQCLMDGPMKAQSKDIVAAAMKKQKALARELDLWMDLHLEEMPFPESSYRFHTTCMTTAYLRLVILLPGFQSTEPEMLRTDSDITVKTVDAARTVIQIMLEQLFPTGFLRYATDSMFLYVSFAAAFLIHLSRPRFRVLLDESLRMEIISLVSRLTFILGSNDVALDGRHTPALYSRFLASLLSKHNLTTGDTQFKPVLRTRNIPSAGSEPSIPDEFFWPYIQPSPDNIGKNNSGAQTDRDFSLGHFIRTVVSHPLSSNDANVPEIWNSWKGQSMGW